MGTTPSRSKMPEPDLDIAAANVRVEWGSLRVDGPGVLRLTSEELLLDVATGGSLRVRYDDLRGGGWRTGVLTVHGDAGNASIESNQGLDVAWVQLVERTCPMPELVRSHRLLGSRRGGSADAQVKFLAPLLQARKRVESGADLETRVALLEGRVLRERVVAALQTIAKDVYPANNPDRRGLEAELDEAMVPFYRGLDALDAAATRFRGAPEPLRFHAWRQWILALSNAFALADSGWANAARLLPTSLKP